MSDTHTYQARMLMIDDDPLVIRALLPALQEHGDVIVATSGERALDLLDEQPTLILLDLNLPDYHGADLIRIMQDRLDNTDLPILVLTGEQDTETEISCLEAGASDFLRKPVTRPLLAARLKLHLDLQQKTQLLKDLATLDGLTGIANRRTFESVYQRYWGLMYRQQAPLSVLFIDLDHFKSINDQYGHDAGDRCLVHVARLLKDLAKRPSDLVCRYGGEEFVVLLPDTDANGARTLAERIRMKLAESPIVVAEEGQTHQVTASLGLATEIPRVSQAHNRLIQQADRAVYRAKASGRNRVESETESAHD